MVKTSKDNPCDNCELFISIQMNKEEEGSNVEVTGETIEVLVEHWLQNFVNRRLIISQNELELLKLNILKGFLDVLTPEIADATGLSHTAVHQAVNRSRVLGVIHLMIFNEKYNKVIELLDKTRVKNGSKLSVLVKPKKKTANKVCDCQPSFSIILLLLF